VAGRWWLKAVDMGFEVWGRAVQDEARVLLPISAGRGERVSAPRASPRGSKVELYCSLVGHDRHTALQWLSSVCSRLPYTQLHHDLLDLRRPTSFTLRHLVSGAMSGPRRQRSFMRPFPTLSLLAIYSTTPVASFFPPTGKQDDAAVEASKVLFLHSAEEDISAERRARLMGTVMGMADFAR